MPGELFQLIREGVTQADERRRPEQRAARIEADEPPDRHAEDAREWRRHRAQSRHEFRDQQRAGAMARERVFGSADAGVRLQGDPAKELEDADPLAPPELVPDQVRGERRHGRQQEHEARTPAARAGERAGGDENRSHRKRNSHSLDEDGAGEQGRAVAKQDFGVMIHDRLRRANADRRDIISHASSKRVEMRLRLMLRAPSHG